MANEEKTNLPEKAASKKPEKKKPNAVAKWYREMKSELKKVVWPTRQDTTKNTGIALAFMAVAAVVIWGFDSLASGTVQALISLLG